MVTVWRCRLEKLVENSQAQFLLVVKCVQRDCSGLAKFLRLSEFPLRFLQVCCQIAVPSTSPLLGPKIVEIFCQVLGGLQGVGKIRVFVQYCCCISLAADKKEIVILEVPVLRLFCASRSNEVHSKKVKKWDQKRDRN